MSQVHSTEYRSVCQSCSWVGRSRRVRLLAVRDGGEHEVAAADPGDIHDHHYTKVVSGTVYAQGGSLH